MRYHKIPDETVRRLPVYLRAALHLSGRGVESTSSQALADLIGVKPWLIRKDFSYFGDFGVPGVGYNLNNLIKHVNRILRLDAGQKAALIGVGNLGSALLAFPGFRKYGLEITAAFDLDKRKIGRKRSGIVIEDVNAMTDLCARGIRLGIVAVPESAAQQTVEMLAHAGVKGILNFSPRHVVTPRGMKVITIDIAMDLARLPYYVPAG